MNSFINDLKVTKAFIATSLLFISIGTVILITQDKVQTHIFINALNSPFLDFFFKYWTYLGDGVLTPIVILFLGVYHFKKKGIGTFLLGFGTLITSGILAQTLKRIVFSDALRPIGIIEIEKLHLIKGVEIHTNHSFPSGHTAAGFAFMIFIACYFFPNNKVAQVIFALIAVLIGYSRVYLSQHFLEDVVCGAILGVLSYIIVLFVKNLLQKKQPNNLASQK